MIPFATTPSCPINVLVRDKHTSVPPKSSVAILDAAPTGSLLFRRADDLQASAHSADAEGAEDNSRSSSTGHAQLSGSGASNSIPPDVPRQPAGAATHGLTAAAAHEAAKAAAKPRGRPRTREPQYYVGPIEAFEIHYGTSALRTLESITSQEQQSLVLETINGAMRHWQKSFRHVQTYFVDQLAPVNNRPEVWEVGGEAKSFRGYRLKSLKRIFIEPKFAEHGLAHILFPSPRQSSQGGAVRVGPSRASAAEAEPKKVMGIGYGKHVTAIINSLPPSLMLYPIEDMNSALREWGKQHPQVHHLQVESMEKMKDDGGAWIIKGRAFNDKMKSLPSFKSIMVRPDFRLGLEMPIVRHQSGLQRHHSHTRSDRSQQDRDPHASGSHDQMLHHPTPSIMGQSSLSKLPYLDHPQASQPLSHALHRPMPWPAGHASASNPAHLLLAQHYGHAQNDPPVQLGSAPLPAQADHRHLWSEESLHAYHHASSAEAQPAMYAAFDKPSSVVHGTEGHKTLAAHRPLMDDSAAQHASGPSVRYVTSPRQLFSHNERIFAPHRDGGIAAPSTVHGALQSIDHPAPLETDARNVALPDHAVQSPSSYASRLRHLTMPPAPHW
ncbi:hypothetical protein IE81DRAFT_142511 [Ceraceosorus guamensis]|uniref:Uncharacterized protein n=1 Tax=Ceraceosorus guamensis TaxID=1522189 RepID=A0A316VXA6_9BASI|nr:hypothetical protein IE81DRAFT_142511 [Ceraceosorus guamensis]PWN42100.1 hypothetical protein IE81DRAFT_142511 [Ceraceosorus guamensis]